MLPFSVVIACPRLLKPYLATRPILIKLDDGLKQFQSMESMFKTVCPNNLTSTSDELKVQLSDITSQVKDLLSNNNQLQKQIETITTSLNNLHKKSYAAAVQTSHPSLQYSPESCSTQPSLGQSQLPGQTQPPTPFEHRNAVSSVINEEKEKQKRRFNLIVHNVAEFSADQAQTRKEQDIVNIRDILGSQLELQPHISNTIRLERKGGPKPRFLKITVESEEEKAAILRNVKKLRLPSTPEHLRRMFITPDLTLREQKVNKALCSELTEDNKSGHQFKIKNGQIAQRRD